MCRALAREKLKFGDACKFKYACAIMDWCNTKLSIGSSENYAIWWLFWLVEEENILIHHDYEIISGSKKSYSFRSSNTSMWIIWTSELSFFFYYCIVVVGKHVQIQNGSRNGNKYLWHLHKHMINKKQ